MARQFFSDYSKLYLDEWRKYSMKMTRRRSRFLSLPSPKFALHIFFPRREFSSMSICPSNITQLRKIPNVVNRTYRRHKRVGPAGQITKIRKAIQHLELIRAIISGVKSETAGMMFITCDDKDKDGTRLMIATDRPSDNLIVTVSCVGYYIKWQFPWLIVCYAMLYSLDVTHGSKYTLSKYFEN